MGAPADDFASRRYLVVEDYDPMCGVLRELLRRCGAQKVSVAANGTQAMQALSMAKFDVVLCDHNLGLGRNGQQVLEESRHRRFIGPATVFVIVTGEKTPDMVMGIVEHEPDDYLIKPFTEAVLHQRLTRLLKRKRDLGSIQKALREGAFGQAIEECDRLMAQDPSSVAQLRRLKADTQLRLGRLSDARATYEGQMADREVAWARTGLAKAAFQEGRLDEAAYLLRQTVEINGAYLEAYEWLSRVLDRQGNVGEARAVLQRSLEVSSRSAYRQLRLGELSLRSGDLDTATEAFQRSIALDTHSALRTPAAHLGLARTLSEAGQIDEALKVLATIRRDFEGTEARLLALAVEVEVHSRKGDAELASALVDDLARQVASNGHLLGPLGTLHLGEVLLAGGQRQLGTDMLGFVARNHHEDSDILARVQEAFSEAGLAEEGRRVLESSCRDAVESMDRSARLAAEGHLDEALEAMQAARAKLPNNPRMLYNHASLLVRLLEQRGWHHGHYSEALRCITHASRFAADTRRAGELMGRLEELQRRKAQRA